MKKNSLFIPSSSSSNWRPGFATYSTSRIVSFQYKKKRTPSQVVAPTGCIIILPSNASLTDNTTFYPSHSESYFTMLASEEVLARDWDSPEEDRAWANL